MAASPGSTSLFPDHPQRFELNDEVHARPPQALVAPLRLTYLAMLSPLSQRELERRLVSELAERYGAAPPPAGINHYAADFGPFRLKWERHTEFSRYKFIVPGNDSRAPFAQPGIDAVPVDWLGHIPGQVIVATHAALLPFDGEEALDYERIAAAHFGGNSLVGAAIAGGAGVALTDFRIQPDGYSRLLVQDRGLTSRQAGRMVQRLLEIDTYRVMALLGLPVARELGPFLNQRERELAEITKLLAQGREEDESALLDRLTKLEAEIESRESDNHYRFGAAAAYHDLVERRIEELRELRIGGLQTFEEFIERRLAPAMQTCRASAARQESLSGRVARATALLSTRVDLTRERQNQALLASMDRRARLQLRLQQTVEGLSVAAITYYVVALVGYLAKGAKAAGQPVDPDIAMAVSIPVVALIAFVGTHWIRTRVASRDRHNG